MRLSHKPRGYRRAALESPRLRSMKRPRNLFTALFAIVLFVAAVCGQSVPRAADSTDRRELNMLVLGDSILWGQGLKEEHKSWFLVKSWLEESGVLVRARIEAHAGAVVGAPGIAPPKFLTTYGEVNSAWPTLNDQIDNALRAFADPRDVDLVLVDGCINDVSARRFLNAANTANGIQALAAEKCGEPVQNLLIRIASSFPNAHIVATGYYPVISEETPHDLFMRALAKRFYSPMTAEGPKLSDYELLKRLATVSDAWYEASNRSLMAAVEKTNVALASKGSRQRALFAKIAFSPEHAFAAKESRLWGFDATTLRKMLAVVTLGKVNLRSNDEVRNQRASMCEEFFKRGPGETDEQKRQRKNELMVCRLAAIAHPNRKGAVQYAESIEDQLRTFIQTPGWLRMPAASAAASQ